jgi:phage/plasmid-like protein (TIGR03299 family)
MFYYGEMPWHRKGVKLEHPADLEEALYWGNLDWEVELIPLQTIEDDPPFRSPVPMRMAVVRKEVPPGFPGRVLGVVHPGFKPLQNRQGAEVFDAIFGRREQVYHTGGYLGEGQVVWLLARLPIEITIAGEDIVEPYILYSNSHDGSRAIDFRLTAVRVVCQNTLNLALNKRDMRKAFRRSHSGNYDSLLNEFAGFFMFTINAAKLVENSFQKLSQQKCSPDAFTEFAHFLFSVPNHPESQQEQVLRTYHLIRDQMVAERRALKQKYEQANDTELSSARGTWWSALNAVTGYVDHDQKTRRERYSYVMFGHGDVLKRKAYELAIKTAR